MEAGRGRPLVVGRWILLLVGGVTTVVTFLFFAVGMMAP